MQPDYAIADDRCCRPHCFNLWDVRYRGLKLCREHWRSVCDSIEQAARRGLAPERLDAVADGLICDLDVREVSP